ncbi:hypothetical protein BUALT_Bualt11G0032300 [Buddleja alternifolia]|uniref:Pre-mRNA-splicing factor 38 n=1 Tax=Buddleja alternifolia TaxID=168488 RepID=A0AAV6WZF2_9LAMI|nr:hypothetical protein BUALT_Bualt11G0032300 [Buddleja alternifolia]
MIIGFVPYSKEAGILNWCHEKEQGIGFLYLRYVADPKTLWSWYEPYMKDDEEFSAGSNGRMTTMGVYVRDMLLGQYYFDTLLPRIPVLVLRSIVSNLENMKLPTKHWSYWSRDSYRRDYDRRDRDEHYHREGSFRRSRSIYENDQNRSSRSRHESKEKASTFSNLAKLKDLYGDLNTQKEDAGKDKGLTRASGTEEVIRLGGSSWR